MEIVLLVALAAVAYYLIFVDKKDRKGKFVTNIINEVKDFTGFGHEVVQPAVVNPADPQGNGDELKDDTQKPNGEQLQSAFSTGNSRDGTYRLGTVPIGHYPATANNWVVQKMQENKWPASISVVNGVPSHDMTGFTYGNGVYKYQSKQAGYPWGYAKM